MSSACDPRVIMFDLDGTLVPTMEGFAEIAADVIAERRGWTRDRAHRAYVRTSGVPFSHQLRELFPGHPDNEAAAAVFEHRKLEHFRAVGMPEEVKEAVRTLDRRGHRLAVTSSNFHRLVREKIEREIPGVFEVVLGYVPGFEKGPDHFGFVMNRLSARPSDCLFVGDSLTDCDRARRAGLRFVGVAGLVSRECFHERDPEAVLESGVPALPELLDEIWAPEPRADAAAG